jgi:hypothetical protein
VSHNSIAVTREPAGRRADDLFTTGARRASETLGMAPLYSERSLPNGCHTPRHVRR